MITFRWLQGQLRKLCLHNWKTGNLPKTSNLDSSQFDFSFKDGQNSPVRSKSYIKEEVKQKQICRSRIQHSGVKVDSLSELSILDDNRSYSSTPVRRRSSASDISFSAASSPTKLGGEARHSTPKHMPQLWETKVGTTPPSRTTVSRPSQSPGVRQGSVYLSEAERILTSQQKELSEVKHRQYKALIHSLQQDVDKSLAPSPSIPSSLFTTPEKKAVKPSQNIVEDNDQDSSGSEVSLMELHCSHVSSSSASPTLAESSTATQSLSGNTYKKLEGSQNSLEDVSSARSYDSNSQKHPEEHKDTLDSKPSSKASSRCSLVKSPVEEGSSTVKKGDTQEVANNMKEDQQSCGQDVDKDRDSWEAEEDFIRTLVHSEAADTRG